MTDNPHGERVPDVPGLLKRHLAATGEKQADVVARAQREGHRLSPQQLSKLAAGFNRCPEADTVRALAVGLRTSERRVWLAVGVSLGLDLGTTEFSDRIPPSAVTLPEEVQDAFVFLLRALSRSSRYASDPATEPDREPNENGPRGYRWRDGPAERRNRHDHPEEGQGS